MLKHVVHIVTTGDEALITFFSILPDDCEKIELHHDKKFLPPGHLIKSNIHPSGTRSIYPLKE
jgi:hypothetical protein